MRHPLIPVTDIPESGSVSADLLGREVLVTMLNGKPRAFINVCMHHGDHSFWRMTASRANGTGPSTTLARATRSQDPLGPMQD
jgi:nitrite reductase/ring-hydroxylating ferredoxin subunit